MGYSPAIRSAIGGRGVRRTVFRARWIDTVRTAMLTVMLGALTMARADGQTDAAAWSLHGQVTYQVQRHDPFPAPYEGTNSFQDRTETRGSFTGTVFAGLRLWRGAEIYANAELLAGSGLSRVLGLAGPPNGETYRVDSTSLKVNFARFFLRQTWNLDDAAEPVADGPNQVATRRGGRRVVLTAGKFSCTDVFDDNAFARDPRTQFNNWSLWANAAWDYPADTRGYTWGIAVEAYRGAWAFRFGSFLVPREANGLEFDHDLRHAHGEVAEVAHTHEVAGRGGTIRLLAFANHARMGNYRDAIARDAEAPDVTATRAPGRLKWGVGVNADQTITPFLGVFARAGWNDGRTESWAFTEIERTATVGVEARGAPWGRSGDRVGLAFAANGTGADHRDYLAAGGLGFMLGDGRLRYGEERIVELYYSLGFGGGVAVSFEAERFANLAFNRDRGPVTVLGARVHFER